MLVLQSRLVVLFLCCSIPLVTVLGQCGRQVSHGWLFTLQTGLSSAFVKQRTELGQIKMVMYGHLFVQWLLKSSCTVVGTEVLRVAAVKNLRANGIVIVVTHHFFFLLNTANSYQLFIICYIQLSPEQHKFEPWESTYPGFFLTVNTAVLQICGWLNLWMWNCGCRGTLHGGGDYKWYTDFPLRGGLGAPKPCTVHGQLYWCQW